MSKHAPQPLPPHDWKSQRTAAFTARHDDSRQLLMVDHPWAPSKESGYGEWSCRAKTPEGWRPGDALFLSFYQSDNYTGTWHEGMGAQAFIGHRFKQLLVNGEVVWEQDVADDEWAYDERGYEDGYRVVDITAHARGEMVLALRIVDRVPSTTPLTDDHYHRYLWSAHDPDVARRNFQTTAWFGDIHLTTTAEPVRYQAPELLAAPAENTARRMSDSVKLQLLAPGKLPSTGCPVRSGVPLPQGWAKPRTRFALRESRGRDVPVATTESEHWPDGSIRWLLCEFVARREGAHILTRDEQPASPEQPVRARRRGEALTIGNGLMRLRFDGAEGAGLFDQVALADGIAIGRTDLTIKLNRVGWRDCFTGHRTSVAIERANEVCVTLRIEGDMLDAEGNRFGPWRARVTVWEGLPWLQVDWRLINETDQAMAVLLDWSARLALPDLCGASVDFGPFTPGYDPHDVGVLSMGHYDTATTPRAMPLYADAEVSCRQERSDQARIYRNTSWVATAEQAAGFVNITHPRGGLAASMRWFAEECPKGFVVRPDMLAVAVLPEYEGALGWTHDRPSVRLGRGEGKRQSFALWLYDGSLKAAEVERFNRCIQDAPRLFAQDWFIASGALECGPPRRSQPMTKWDRAMTARIEQTGIACPRLGHREYWDTCWNNDYRGRAHLGLLQFVETGEPRWLRYFDAACTHTRDIDIIHFCPEHPQWIGATHSYGEDHTSCGPMGNIGLNVDSLLEHYLLTGDADSLEAAEGLSAHILTCPAWSRSAREVGWPLAQVVRWYEHSGDERFLAKAHELFAAARALTEPRRGIFDEQHGCWNYRGAVPFMTGYLAFGVIRYHRLTGEPEALHLLRMLADGLFEETRMTPGHFRYSPFPELNVVGRYRAWNALVGGLTGYIYWATGDAASLARTRECYAAIVEESEEMQVTMDMLQTAGWMLRAIAKGASDADT